jgi:hypothetical protein
MAEGTDSDGGALVGAMVAGGFGAAWSLWAATGLPATAAAVARIAGVAIAVAIVAGGVVLHRFSTPRPAPDEGSMFSSTPYRVTVALEVAALVGGNLLLNGTGHQKYVIAWVAAVVGIHFLAFGRLFWTGFYWLGAALVTSGAIAAIVGLSGGGADAVTALCGLLTAGSLFVAGASTLVRARSTPEADQVASVSYGAGSP